MAFTHVTGNAAEAWRPDVTVLPQIDVLGEALINTITTVAGSVEGDQQVVHVGYVDDATATVYAEGAEFGEAEPTLGEATFSTVKVGQLVRVSRELFHQSGTSGNLAGSVQRALTSKLDQLLISQPAPVSPATTPVAGLENVAGVTDAGTVAVDLDELIDLEATVRAAGAAPTAWVLAPSTWAQLRKLKTASGSNQSLLGAGTSDTERSLLSLPVIISGAVTAGSGMLVDRSQVISAVSPVTVATSEQVYFSSDSMAVRATARIGFCVPKPARIGKFTIAVQGS